MEAIPDFNVSKGTAELNKMDEHFGSHKETFRGGQIQQIPLIGRPHNKSSMDINLYRT